MPNDDDAVKGPPFKKVKLSDHQRKSMELELPDHDVTEDQVAEAVMSPSLIEISGTRLVYWSKVAGEDLKTVVSAAISGGFSIARIVTAYWHEFPWVYREPTDTDEK